MNVIEPEQFLKLKRYIPVVDVRSPSEYQKGHIPGSYSIPLFDDEQRARVGTSYKKLGREEAVMEGLRIVGPRMEGLAKSARDLAGDGHELVVHCWRGGMRSESMAWLFEKLGIRCHVLRGGYKHYRNYGRARLSQPGRVIILGGYTGSGKTDILKAMEAQGQQVLDLEALANHKGSAFGGMGQDNQPSNEHFENLLFDRWMTLNPDQPIWIEDESKMIGKNTIPDELFHVMRSSPVIRIEMNRALRVERLVREYTGFDKALLQNAIQRIEKRLGGQNAREADEAVERGDFYTAVDISLDYYDKAYRYGLGKRKLSTIYALPVEEDDPAKNATLAIGKAREVFDEQSVSRKG